MGQRENIIREIKSLPYHLLEEVADFVASLKQKKVQEKLDITLASESSLGKDWLTPEEDQAWQDL